MIKGLKKNCFQIINTLTGLDFSIPEKEETINMRNAWTDHKESGR